MVKPLLKDAVLDETDQAMQDEPMHDQVCHELLFFMLN